MSFIEGGGKFVDYINDFSTTDKKEWDEHQKEVGITQSGSSPCGLCQTKVRFTDLPYGKQPICDECKEELK